ncbi:MAG: hypothetical protein K2L11_03715 [Muribaculaceae bacterium]|nr:hypothetical protein [Muribaculaceae bacterium]
MLLSHPTILPTNICYCVKLQLDLPKSHYYTKADLGTPTTGQPYKFGGKELITANGLNEYDFGARNYYPAVPAFTRIDPMAEKYPWLSPYLYCANNPMNLIDPTGKVIEMPKGSTNEQIMTVMWNMQLTDDNLVFKIQKDGTIRIKIASTGEVTIRFNQYIKTNMKYSGVIIVLLLVLISCYRNNNENTNINSNTINSVVLDSDTTNNSSLVLLIHSGIVLMNIHNLDTTVLSETQIIYCSPTTMKYGYGSVILDSDTLKNDMEWFSDYQNIENYSIIERNLNTEEQAFVNNSIKALSNTRYEDPIIVKDDWEYHLYANGIRVASGNVSSIDSFPDKIREIIKRLLKIASPLYQINGFA